jgi:hypothetical protein
MRCHHKNWKTVDVTLSDYTLECLDCHVKTKGYMEFWWYDE